MIDDEAQARMAEIAGLTLEEFDRRLALQAELERLIDSVTHEQLEEKFGCAPEGDEAEFMRRDIEINLLGLPHDSTRCHGCGGTGDSFRSPAGIVRCRTCGGHCCISG